MIRMNGERSGFTLVELLVVVAMIAVLTGAMTTAIAAAQNRARIQKATSDVKVISQAILGYENYSQGGKFELEPMERRDADKNSLKFLLGEGKTTDSGGKIPVLLMAALRGNGQMVDPWGTPYKVTIREGNISVKMSSLNGLQTGYYLPNAYRLGLKERGLK